MTRVPERWHRPALLALGLVCGLVGGPVFLFNGVRAIDRGGSWDTVGGWFMVVGGVIALGAGMALLVLLRRKPWKPSE